MRSVKEGKETYTDFEETILNVDIEDEYYVSFEGETTKLSFRALVDCSCRDMEESWFEFDDKQAFQSEMVGSKIKSLHFVKDGVHVEEKHTEDLINVYIKYSIFIKIINSLGEEKTTQFLMYKKKAVYKYVRNK